MEIQSPGNEPGEVPAMNLWEFYNVVTWYITHRAASLTPTLQKLEGFRAKASRVKL
ncbi:MAG: hypothetical protein HGJ94_15465 [Desulfosarcina sp.]|nr:hypothetical protein [Desulfosarcina sp.]